MKIWIILPAYNEENSIPLLYPKIKDFFGEIGERYEILVVDDGSVDGTKAILEKMANEYPQKVIYHTINRGLGESERDAFEWISRNADAEDIAIRMDCDDTHEPEYIQSMIDKIHGGFDVVNTSRFRPGGGQKGVNAYRTAISYAANGFMKVIFNIHGVRDYSCGFRAYRVRVLQDAITIFGNGFIQLKGLGFTSTLETIVKLKLLGCRFAEVPFMLRYDKKASPSKMVGSITTLGYIAMALLYHSPLGGWRWFYRKLGKVYRASADEAYKRYAKGEVKRPTMSQIGG